MARREVGFRGVIVIVWGNDGIVCANLEHMLCGLGKSTVDREGVVWSIDGSPVLNLGFEGYKKIAYKDLRNARMLSRALESTYFTILSNIHIPISPEAPNSGHADDAEAYQPGLPVVAFRLSDEYKKANPNIQQGWIQTLLRTKGWIVPNYNAPPGAEDVEILRVVVRETLSEDLIERLIVDIISICESLTTQEGNIFAAVTADKGVHKPDHDEARPEKANFGDENSEAEPKGQTGFSRQC